MHVDVIESFDSLAALESNWKALYRRDPDAQLFLSWSWLSWVFREHPRQWRVLAVKLDRYASEYVSFFPIRLKTIWSKSKRRFRNEIHMAGRLAWAQYTGFLCDPDHEEVAMAGLALHLKTMHWSRLSLKYVQTSDLRMQRFLQQFSDDLFEKAYHELTINKGATNNLICPYIELPDDFDTYLQTQLSANTRQKDSTLHEAFREIGRSQDNHCGCEHARRASGRPRRSMDRKLDGEQGAESRRARHEPIGSSWKTALPAVLFTCSCYGEERRRLVRSAISSTGKNGDCSSLSPAVISRDRNRSSAGSFTRTVFDGPLKMALGSMTSAMETRRINIHTAPRIAM